MLGLFIGALLEIPIAIFGDDKSKRRSRMLIAIFLITALVTVVLVSC